MDRDRRIKKKLHYTSDAANGLCIRDDGEFQRLNGVFKVDETNRLFFWLNEPTALKRRFDIPDKIVFAGTFRLDENHDLQFELKDSPGQYGGERITLQGEIVSCRGDELLFQINCIDKDGMSHISFLRFSGQWQSDETNRLIFTIAHTNEPDVLTLSGSWQLSRNQQVIYEYQKSALRTKEKKLCRLEFEGSWHIDAAHRLKYILEGSSESFFDFRVSLESPTLYPQRGKIKYRIGTGVSQKQGTAGRRIELFGVWKFDRSLGISFEMNLGKGKVRAIAFGTRVSLTGRNEIDFSLLNSENEPVGLQLRCTHRFLNDSGAATYVRLKKRAQETLIEAGVNIPF